MMIFQSVMVCPERGQLRLHRLVLVPADIGMMMFGENVDEVVSVTHDGLAQQVTDRFILSFAGTHEEGLAIGRRVRERAEAEGATCIDLDTEPENTVEETTT